MTDLKALAAPGGLQDKGLRLWRDVAGSGVYRLRPDELLVLEDACREADLIDRLEAELRDADLIVRGSMGQPVANPLAQELRQHRGVFARLMKQLDLPDGTPVSSSRSSQARDAAAARWAVPASGAAG